MSNSIHNAHNKARDSWRTALAALAVVFGLTLGTAQAQASTLIQYASDENLTLDTNTNFLWYDLAPTTNISWLQMEANFLDTNSVFFGFRHATAAEVNTYWTNADLGAADNINQENYFSGVLQTAFDTYIQLTDLTFENPFVKDQRGFTADCNSGNCNFAFLRRSIQENIPDLRDTTLINGVNNEPFTDNGHYIVKDAPSSSVPEPESLYLYALGFASIYFMNKRRRQVSS